MLIKLPNDSVWVNPDHIVAIGTVFDNSDNPVPELRMTDGTVLRPRLVKDSNFATPSSIVSYINRLVREEQS